MPSTSFEHFLATYKPRGTGRTVSAQLGVDPNALVGWLFARACGGTLPHITSKPVLQHFVEKYCASPSKRAAIHEIWGQYRAKRKRKGK